MVDLDRFLVDLTDHRARFYTGAIQDIFTSYVMGDRQGVAAAREQLADVQTETMGTAEVLGALMSLRTAADATANEKQTLRADRQLLIAFAEKPTQTILPRVTFEEAVQDLIDRTPVTLRRAAERTAQRIAELYSERRVTAFARAAEAAVTRQAQDFIRQALSEGIPEGEAGRRLALKANEIRKRSKSWSEGYARLVFRTNVNTAVTAGRFRQAQDPDIKAVIPAFRFSSVGDADTRDNHDAADGVVLRVDNPLWGRIAPPLGYNCRCRVEPMSRPQLRRMGVLRDDGSIQESRLPFGAGPDPGFRHASRPDLFMVEQSRR